MVRGGSLCALNLGVQVHVLWIGKTWGRRGRKHSKLKKLKFHWQRTRSERNSILWMVRLMYVFVLVNTQQTPCQCHSFIWPLPRLSKFLGERRKWSKYYKKEYSTSLKNSNILIKNIYGVCVCVLCVYVYVCTEFLKMRLTIWRLKLALLKPTDPMNYKDFIVQMF